MAAGRGSTDAPRLRRCDRLRSGDLRRAGATRAGIATVAVFDHRRSALFRANSHLRVPRTKHEVGGDFGGGGNDAQGLDLAARARVLRRGAVQFDWHADDAGRLRPVGLSPLVVPRNRRLRDPQRALIAFPAGRGVGLVLGAIIIAVALATVLRRRELSHAPPLTLFAALLALVSLTT